MSQTENGPKLTTYCRVGNIPSKKQAFVYLWRGQSMGAEQATTSKTHRWAKTTGLKQRWNLPVQPWRRPEMSFRSHVSSLAGREPRVWLCLGLVWARKCYASWHARSSRWALMSLMRNNYLERSADKARKGQRNWSWQTDCLGESAAWEQSFLCRPSTELGHSNCGTYCFKTHRKTFWFPQLSCPS